MNCKKDIERLAKFYCCHFMLSNLTKDYDRSLYPVSEFITRATALEGLSIVLCKEVYGFIKEYMPYGCYVSGCPAGSWDEDYFVLGNLNEETCLKEINRLIAENERCKK